MMWLVYLYFIREALFDIFELLSETVRWALADDERPSVPAISRFLETVRIYGIVIVGNGAALIIWALYNQLRFRGRDRHRPAKLVDPDALSELYGIPAHDIALWQKSRILVMHHDPDGTLVNVVTKDPGQILPMVRRKSPADREWSEQIV